MPLEATFETAYASGCMQAGADLHETVEDAKKQFGVTYYGLLGATKLDPCTTGCPAFNNGMCDCFVEHFTNKPNLIVEDERPETPEERQARIDRAIKPPGTRKFPGKSVRAIAKETGMSIRQVRRAKINGAI